MHTGVRRAVTCSPSACASVLAHTPRDVRILIADDASPDPAIERFVTSIADGGGLARHDVRYLRQPENLGFPGNVNAAFAAAAPADVVVLNSDCVVAAGWLQGLRRAAYSDALVATASALTNHGTILSVPERNRPLPGLPQHQLLDAGRRSRAGAIAAAVPAPADGDRALHVRAPPGARPRRGLRSRLLAGLWRGGRLLPALPAARPRPRRRRRRVRAAPLRRIVRRGRRGEPDRAEHEAIIDARYPYYQRAQTAAGQAELGPLPRSLAAARRAMNGLTATIDARCLGQVMTGTQVHTLEVIRALSHTGQRPACA